MAIWIERTEQRLERIIEALQQVIFGNQNNIGSVTLRTGQTTTVVTRDIIAKGAHIAITARTANAGLEIGNGTLYIDPAIQGSFTIHHASNAQADRTFSYSVTGGD